MAFLVLERLVRACGLSGRHDFGIPMVMRRKALFISMLLTVQGYDTTTKVTFIDNPTKIPCELDSSTYLATAA